MYFKLKIIGYLIRFKWVQFRYASKLKHLQTKRWKKYLNILSKSPFYSKFLSKSTKLEDYPIVNKQAFMENFDTINTSGIALEKAMAIAINA